MEYVIEPQKISCGARMVPMTPDVRDCLATIIANRKKQKKEHICDKYNSIYKVQMPKITPHACRNTFCSNMAKSGMNPKTLQYSMGHSDIGVMLNTYTHIGCEDA